MGFIKKGKEEISTGDRMRKAKDTLKCDDKALSELNGALKRLHRLEEVTEFVQSTDWKQRCTLLFELIYQRFDGRGTAEELLRYGVIEYIAAEVTEDFKEVFGAIRTKYPRIHLNSTVHGYLIHVQKLVQEERDFEYPDEILDIAGTMIIGKLKGFTDKSEI